MKNETTQLNIKIKEKDLEKLKNRANRKEMSVSEFIRKECIVKISDEEQEELIKKVKDYMIKNKLKEIELYKLVNGIEGVKDNTLEEQIKMTLLNKGRKDKVSYLLKNNEEFIILQ